MIPHKDRLHIPSSFGKLLDTMTFMLLCSPKFVDRTGYLPWQNLETSFYRFNEGLRRLRPQLGEALYQKLTAMSDQMRAYFEADPDEKTGETRKGKDLVYDMEELIKARWAEVRARRKRPGVRTSNNGKPRSSAS